MQELLPMTEVTSIQKVKLRGQRSRSQRSTPNLAVSGPYLQFEFTYDDEMMHRAWCCLGKVPYCFSRSSVKFQGHMAKKIIDFDPNLAFPDCNSRLNSPAATKCAQSLKQHRRGAILYFKVIHQISRSHRTTNGQFCPELGVSGL